MIVIRWCATSTSPHCWSTDLSRARCFPIFVLFLWNITRLYFQQQKTVYLEKHCNHDKLLAGEDEVPNDGLLGRGQASSSTRGWQTWEGGLQVEWGFDLDHHHYTCHLQTTKPEWYVDHYHDTCRLQTTKPDPRTPHEATWAPILWALKLLSRARQEGKITLEPPVIKLSWTNLNF